MKKKIKYLFFGFLACLALCIIPNISKAENDTYTATTVINGANISWKYELNESNQITNLKCTNVSELSGKITIPDTIDNKTVISIGNNAFNSASSITEVTIPKTVTEIEYGAFENCKNLNKVDLGNITTLSFEIFKGCTNLTEITIPKTLKYGSGTPCLDNPNITKINLEEGLTIVPKNLCANTGITEITIPSSVTEIEYDAFKDCKNLKKITILDNVNKMGFYNNDDSDSVFQNHNSDLTIYCYENSIAAQYAIKYNIKYVYLQRQESQTPGENNKNSENSNKENQESEGKQEEGKKDPEEEGKKDPDEDDTKAKDDKLPYTGKEITVIMIMLGLAIVAIVAYSKVRYLKEV